MMDHVLGLWFIDGGYGFLLRRFSPAGVADLDFDGVYGCCPGLIRCNGSTFDEPPWRFAKLHISDGAASSSGEEVSVILFFGSCCGGAGGR